MSRLIRLLLTLFIATVVAIILLWIGVIVTTVMFQSQYGPGYLGRTWQDKVVIVSVIVLYIGYTVKSIVNFFIDK